MLPRSRAAACGLALLALLVLPTVAPAADGCALSDVPLVGRACAVPGGYRVLLADGTWIFTHGPDPPPTELLSYPLSPAPDIAGTLAVCAATPAEPQGVIVYANPSDRADRFATMKPQIQAMWQDAAARMYYTGVERGIGARYRMACEGTGALNGLPSVASVHLAAPVSGTSFGSVVNDLEAAGFNLPTNKYWVWVDLGYGAGGIGNIWGCEVLACPLQNVGPLYGVTWGHTGYYGSLVMMHENGHNLGAVQLGAPNTSGAFHCNDGLDIMCYADGGKNSAYDPTVCSGNPPPGPPGARWDCNGDDYFNPLPAPGSYLSLHWNLASPANLYVVVAP
ncbi:MAG TPA: hypothetical protein VGR28_06360 [Candidatus Thermoplasmatota archaeon]|jgi:hypothetical protein|nr:hypothetical protein [Candidatus Thermoplasmatota archaeon]